MSKAVLVSINPKWCAKIASGRKTMELRKSKPKLAEPFKCYIYETKIGLRSKSHENDILVPYKYAGKVIGEFVCDNIMRQCQMQNADLAEQQSLVKRERIFEYANGKEVYGWHISDLKIYDTPKKLEEFLKPCPYGDVSCFLCDKSGYTPEMKIDCCNNVTRPPQSWCYVEDVQ